MFTTLRGLLVRLQIPSYMLSRSHGGDRVVRIRWPVATSLPIFLACAVMGCTGGAVRHVRHETPDLSPYVGLWDTRPNQSYCQAVMELRDDGTFRLDTLGYALDLVGRWRPVDSGIEVTVLWEEGMSWDGRSSSLSSPPRLFLYQNANGLLDARPIPTGGARYFERRPRPSQEPVAR